MVCHASGLRETTGTHLNSASVPTAADEAGDLKAAQPYPFLQLQLSSQTACGGTDRPVALDCEAGVEHGGEGHSVFRDHSRFANFASEFSTEALATGP